jgi:hypothetical protein
MHTTHRLGLRGHLSARLRPGFPLGKPDTWSRVVIWVNKENAGALKAVTDCINRPAAERFAPLESCDCIWGDLCSLGQLADTPPKRHTSHLALNCFQSEHRYDSC